MHIPEPLPNDPEAMEMLVERLRRAGFRFPAILKRLGLDEYRMWHPANDYWGDVMARSASVARYRLEQPRDDLDRLIRLFLINDASSSIEELRVFSPAEVASLERLHLVRVESNRVVSNVHLYECQGLFLATDATMFGNPDINPVMSLIPESHEFAATVIRRPLGKSLDLCTGSGIHALLQSRHVRQVLAVDINPRAVAFARFNQALNRITNVEFRLGDLYGAVEPGARFDLITANPPYLPVIDSAAGDNFYSGGRSGYGITERILSGLDDRLLDGGHCQLLQFITIWNDAPLEQQLRGFLPAEGQSYGIVVLGEPLPYELVVQRLKYWNGDDAFLRREASGFEWGIINVRRERGESAGYYVHGPYDPYGGVAIDALFDSLRS